MSDLDSTHRFGMYATGRRRSGVGCGGVIAFNRGLRRDTCVPNPPGGSFID